MKKLLAVFISILIISLLNINTYAAPNEDISINTKASILIDGKTGQVIYEQNSDTRLYPASTTKIITAVLAIENGKMDQQMTASKAAVNEIGINGSNVGIASGEILPMEDLLNAMLIKSANDCANIIAENISSTRSEFIDLMNKRATELGATNTTFTNTCGLDKSDAHPNHMTTVSDMSKIARYAMTLPKFREIVVKQKYTMPDTNKHPSTYWPKDYIATTNKFLMGFNKYKSNDFSYTGIKTGYTNLAGCNIIASAQNSEGMELIAVVYGSKDQENLYSETKKLFEYGFNKYGVKTIITEGDIASSISIPNAKESESTLDLKYQESLQTVLPKDYDIQKLTKIVSIRDDLTAPLSMGETVGNIEFQMDKLSLGRVNLIAATDVELAPISVNPFSRTKSSFWSFRNLLIGIVLFFVLILGYKNYFRNNFNKKKIKIFKIKLRRKS